MQIVVLLGTKDVLVVMYLPLSILNHDLVVQLCAVIYPIIIVTGSDNYHVALYRSVITIIPQESICAHLLRYSVMYMKRSSHVLYELYSMTTMLYL